MMDQISKTVRRSLIRFCQISSCSLVCCPLTASIHVIEILRSIQISTCAHSEDSGQNALFERSLCWALWIIKY